MDQKYTKLKTKYPETIKNMTTIYINDLLAILIKDTDKENYACTRLNKSFQDYWEKKKQNILNKTRQSQYSYLFSEYLQNPSRYDNKTKLATNVTLFWSQLWIDYTNIKKGNIVNIKKKKEKISENSQTLHVFYSNNINQKKRNSKLQNMGIHQNSNKKSKQLTIQDSISLFNDNNNTLMSTGARDASVEKIEKQLIKNAKKTKLIKRNTKKYNQYTRIRSLNLTLKVNNINADFSTPLHEQ
jgi:hypothetical protein